MLKQTVQFTDFDGANKTKNIYFNLTRSEVIDEIEIKDEFQEIYDLIASGETERVMEIHEVKMILALVKKLMKLSYGVQKVIDGDIVFTKRDVWETFEETAAYDAFIMSLFEEPGKAIEFLFGIWPQELTKNMDRDQLMLDGMGKNVKMDGQPMDPPVAPPARQDDNPLAQGDPRPAWEREKRSPTEAEMREMGTSEMQRAYRMKVAGELDN